MAKLRVATKSAAKAKGGKPEPVRPPAKAGKGKSASRKGGARAA
jgi:hypothetical protein